MLDIFKKQFIEVIEWTENTDGVLAHRFPTLDKEIQDRRPAYSQRFTNGFVCE